MNAKSELLPKDKKIKISVTALLYFLLIMTVASIQTCIFPRFKLMGAIADATLCTVVIAAFFSNEREGALVGFFAGIVIEAMGRTGISLLPLIYLLTAYFLGSVARYNHNKNFISYLFFAAFGTVVRMVTTFAYTALVATQFNLLEVISKNVLPEALATLICAVVMYYPIGWICRKIRKKLE